MWSHVLPTFPGISSDPVKSSWYSDFTQSGWFFIKFAFLICPHFHSSYQTTKDTKDTKKNSSQKNIRLWRQLVFQDTLRVLRVLRGDNETGLLWKMRNRESVILMTLWFSGELPHQTSGLRGMKVAVRCKALCGEGLREFSHESFRMTFMCL